MEALAEQVLDRLGRPESVELVADFARPFAFGVMCEVLGVAEAHRAELRVALDVVADSQGHGVEEREAAVAVLDAYVRRQFADPGDGVFGEIIRAWIAGNETPGSPVVSREELLDLIAMLLLAGYDSTVQMLAMAVLALTAEPGGLALLAADVGSIPSAVDELLRMDTPGPFATTRHALSDVRIGGTVIPAGSNVLLSVAAANHDHRAHVQPEELRLDRATRHRQLSFGLGPHYCLGSALARMTLASALGALARRWPDLRLAVPPGQLRWSGGFQHRRLSTLPVVVRPSTESSHQDSV